MFTYRNVEAVPEQLEGTDPLREVGLFKQHPSCIDETLPLVAAAKRYWCEAADAEASSSAFTPRESRSYGLTTQYERQGPCTNDASVQTSRCIFRLLRTTASSDTPNTSTISY